MCTSSPSGPDVTLLVDFSKNLITESVLNNLLTLAREVKVEETWDKMFTGGHIITSKDHAVLHVVLRNFNDFNNSESGVDQVSGVLNHMKEFTEAVWSGEWKVTREKQLMRSSILASEVPISVLSWSLRPSDHRHRSNPWYVIDTKTLWTICDNFCLGLW